MAKTFVLKIDTYILALCELYGCQNYKSITDIYTLCAYYKHTMPKQACIDYKSLHSKNDMGQIKPLQPLVPLT